MTLQTYIPAPPLSEYVNMFWYWEGYHPPHARERILPGGMMEITINLTGEGIQTYYPDDAYQRHRFREITVSGARSGYFVVDTSRPANILSVWFKPGGALAFFDTCGDALHNQHVSLEALWGYSAHDLYCRLLDAGTLLQRFRILEATLLARLAYARETHHAVKFALNAFNHLPHAQTVADVVSQIALSPTRFIQVFREETGMTPKRFCRVKRFQQSLHLISRCSLGEKPVDWADIALTCGYFDQSHFINEFQVFAGITPTQYAPQDIEHNSNLPFLE